MDPSSDVEVLSRSDLLAVYRCNSGLVHVRMGMLTLDLTPEQFWELVKCVGEASVRLTVRDVVEEFVNEHAPAGPRIVAAPLPTAARTRSDGVEASARPGPSPIAR